MNTQSFNPAIAYSVYRSRHLAFITAGITAFVMSAYFVVGYLVGNLQFWNWEVNQWMNALPGLGICLAMTLFQVVLYSKHGSAATVGTVLAVCVAAGFSVLSEIGQGMERDNVRMETRSLESPTYQAIVSSIGSAAGTAQTPYSHDLQQANERLATCQKRVQQGVYRDCAESEARVQAVRDLIAGAARAQSDRALALAQTAKAMERDENNYHPLVNLIRTSFGWSGIVASFALSLAIILFFEYAFHYLGRRRAEARDTLQVHGYDTTALPRKQPRSLGAAEKPEMQLPSDLHARVSDSDTGLHARVEGSEARDAYDKADRAKVGEQVPCPQCGKVFTKRNPQHRFCCKEHRFDWHNTQNPERAAVAAKRGRTAG